MAAKYCKRIRVRSDVARTTSPPARQPMKTRRQPSGTSAPTTGKAAVRATRKTYSSENQRRAKSLAPRTPYLRTIGVCEMSDVFMTNMGLRRSFVSKTFHVLDPAWLRRINMDEAGNHGKWEDGYGPLKWGLLS